MAKCQYRYDFAIMWFLMEYIRLGGFMAVWRNIQGFPNYMVSSDGDVLNKERQRIVRPSYTKYGHAMVTLYLEGARYTRSVNRLVLFAFIGPPPIKENVNYCASHIDGNFENCASDNLEWKPRLRVMAESRNRRKKIQDLWGL